MIRLQCKNSDFKVFSKIINKSCAERNVMHEAYRVYKNLVKSLTGWNKEYQSTNLEPTQSAQEKLRSFMRASTVSSF